MIIVCKLDLCIIVMAEEQEALPDSSQNMKNSHLNLLQLSQKYKKKHVCTQKHLKK